MTLLLLILLLIRLFGNAPFFSLGSGLQFLFKLIHKNSVVKLPTLYLRPDQEPISQHKSNDHALTWRFCFFCEIWIFGRFQVQKLAKRYFLIYFIIVYVMQFFNIYKYKNTNLCNPIIIVLNNRWCWRSRWHNFLFPSAYKTFVIVFGNKIGCCILVAVHQFIEPSF